MNTFKPFQKIPRLNRGIVITEKIDGTNAQIYIPEDKSVALAGSRNRWIKVGDDNYGFAAWVAERGVDLIAALGPGHHYGEWWGKGIQRNYGKNDRTFSLFNVGRWKAGYEPAHCAVVPTLYSGIYDHAAIESTIARLRTDGSVAAPGFAAPEGIVVYHVASGGLFKVTLEKDEAPKGRSVEEVSL